MQSSSRRKGSLAEAKAEEYFKKLGYKILEKNYRAPQGEIDLIVCKGPLLIFVEVKSAFSETPFSPEEKVDFLKQKKIQRVAENYLLKNSEKLSKIKNIRFDVVVINFGKDEVRHYEGAFYSETFAPKD